MVSRSEAAKETARKLRERYGEDYFKRLGKKGSQKSVRPFRDVPGLAKAAGSISRKGTIKNGHCPRCQLAIRRDSEYAKTGTCMSCNAQYWIVGYRQFINGIFWQEIPLALRAGIREDEGNRYEYYPIYKSERIK